MLFIRSDGRRARVGKGARADGPTAPPGCGPARKRAVAKKRFGGFTCRNLRWNRWGGARGAHGALARAHPQAHDKEPGDPDDGDRSTDSNLRTTRTSAMLASLSPLRDRSNDATLTPVAKPAKSRLGVTPTPSKASAPTTVARSPLSALNGSTAARRNTPINAKENKKLAAAAGKPMVFDQAVLSSPAGNKLRKIQGDNDNLRELNRKLMEQLRAARLSTKEATDAAALAAGARASDGEQLQRLNEENSALRSLNTKILVHLKTAQQSARESADVVAQARDQRAEALEKLTSSNEESTKLRDLNNRFIRELRSAREATAKATAAVAAANVKAGDIHEQMDAANEQNARLRELNQRFAAEINSTRKAAGDAESDAKRSGGDGFRVCRACQG